MVESGVVSRILFGILALGALVLPRRWALLCWLLSTQFDLSGIGWQSASALGWANTLRIVVLPSLLLLRFEWAKALATSLRQISFLLWLVFCAYVALASFWSPFILSSVKLLGYLYAYTVSFLILFVASRKGYLSSRLVLLNLWGVLVIAMVQTWWLGNPFGTIERRFTSFLAPQYFAEMLDFLLILVIFLPDLRWRTKLFYGVVLITAIFLSGSRTGFLVGVFILAFAAWMFLHFIIVSQRVLVAYAVLLLCAGLIVALYFLPLSSYSDTFRTWELLALLRREKNPTEIGTMGFRMGMWQATVVQIERSDVWQMLFGHGTTSGGNVALWAFSRYNAASIDANRVIHNEFLRAVYEWGCIGLGLFGAFLFSLLRWGVAQIRRNRQAGFLILSTWGVLVLFLFIENLLAGGGNSAGVALTLNLAYATAAFPQKHGRLFASRLTVGTPGSVPQTYLVKQ